MIRRCTLAFILTAALLFSFAPSATALYQWVDEKGELHITDNPPPSAPSREEPETPRNPNVPLPASAPAAGPALPPTAPQTAKPAPAQAQSSPPAASLPAVSPAAAPPQTMLSPTAPQPVSAPAPAQPAPAPAMPDVKEAPGGNVPSPALPGNMPPANVLAAVVAGFLTVFLFVAAGVYIFFSLCLYLIAKRLNVAEAWAAWIPIIQIWPFLSSAGKPCWWVVLLFIPIVNAFVGVYLWMCIAENLGRNKWLGLLMLLPIINFVLMGVLAFTKEEASEPAHAS